MTRKNYSEQFRAQAVELFESTPGASLHGIATDLGISDQTLKKWVQREGTGSKTPAPGPGPVGSTPAARLARVEAELKASRTELVKLRQERDILRLAAKYFAGETNW